MHTKSKVGPNILKTIILPITIYLVLLISTGGRFGQSASMMLVLRQSVIPIMIAFAVGFNMTMGMWDLSAGAVVYAAAILGTHAANLTQTGVVGMVIFCMAIAIGLSVLTGMLYKFMKVPSIVLTVGVTMLYEALPRLFKISMVKIPISNSILSQLPWCFIILAGAFILFYILFNFTAFGHNVRAIGANQKIARNSGVNIDKTKLISFVLSGVFIGITSVIYMSNMTAIKPTTAFGSSGLIFDSMMGIFIAFFLEKYSNFTVGIVIGAFSMQILTSGLVALGLGTTTRDITQGLFLLVLLIFSSNQGVFDAIRNRKQLARIANEKYRAPSR